MYQINKLTGFCLFLALCYGRGILAPPAHTSVYSGDTVRLHCSADLGEDILEWRHYLNAGTGERIWLSTDGGQPSDPR